MDGLDRKDTSSSPSSIVSRARGRGESRASIRDCMVSPLGIADLLNGEGAGDGTGEGEGPGDEVRRDVNTGLGEQRTARRVGGGVSSSRDRDRDREGENNGRGDHKRNTFLA